MESGSDYASGDGSDIFNYSGLGTRKEKPFGVPMA
jgi:hypothetical protein